MRLGNWCASLFFLFFLCAPAAARDEVHPLTLDDGRTVSATIRIPDGATGRLPAVMLFGGFEHAAEVLDRVRVDRPVIWATFDYPFDAPRKFRFPSSLKYAPQLREAIHGSFDGVVKLHALLRARPDVDPARITVVGASAGSPFATVGAARAGIPGVIQVQGFADVTAAVQNILARRYRQKWGSWVEWPALWLAQGLVWYCEVPDIAAHARALKAHQQVLVFTSKHDTFIPKVASDALLDALDESAAYHEHIELDGGHIGVGDDTAIMARILQDAIAWMERRRLL